MTDEETNTIHRPTNILEQVGELLRYTTELEKENAELKASLEEKINFYNKQGLKKISEIEELEKENARLSKMLEMAINEVLLCGKQMKVEHPTMIVWTEETFRAELEERVREN